MQAKEPGFLRGWLAYNFAGWVMGGMIAIACLNLLRVIHYGSMFRTPQARELGNVAGSIVMWLPLAASVATWQWLRLRRWNVPGRAWIAGTTLAWVLPPAFLPLVLDRLHTSLLMSWSPGGMGAQFVVMVLAVALVQAGVLRGSRAFSAWWVMAYVLGSFVLAFLVLLTWGAAFNLGRA